VLVSLIICTRSYSFASQVLHEIGTSFALTGFWELLYTHCLKRDSGYSIMSPSLISFEAFTLLPSSSLYRLARVVARLRDLKRLLPEHLSMRSDSVAFLLKRVAELKSWRRATKRQDDRTSDFRLQTSTSDFQPFYFFLKYTSIGTL